VAKAGGIDQDTDSYTPPSFLFRFSAERREILKHGYGKGKIFPAVLFGMIRKPLGSATMGAPPLKADSKGQGRWVAEINRFTK
jgi:hypothetical protein